MSFAKTHLSVYINGKTGIRQIKARNRNRRSEKWEQHFYMDCAGKQSESIDDNDTFTEENSNRGSVRDMLQHERELQGVRQISQIGPTYPGVCGGE